MYGRLLLLTVFLIKVIHSSEVSFYLFTTRNPNNPIQVGPQNVSQYIIPGDKTHVFIHGWISNRSEPWYTELKNAFFSRGNYNVIEVDYNKIAHEFLVNAIEDSVVVGAQIGDLLLNLSASGYSLRNITLTGHSLGGQISGYVGKYIFNKTKTKLSRINAMDPGGPLFQPPIILSSYVLNRTDASVVFVIHTNRFFAGYIGDCGTVDVYPNDGILQPGCLDRGISYAIGCSHGRSHQLFVYAVAHKGSLFATRCDNYENFVRRRCENNRRNDLGGKITDDDRGRYYLTTTGEPPYRLRP